MFPRHAVMARIGVIDSASDGCEQPAPPPDGAEFTAVRDDDRTGGQAAMQHVMMMRWCFAVVYRTGQTGLALKTETRCCDGENGGWPERRCVTACVLTQKTQEAALFRTTANQDCVLNCPGRLPANGQTIQKPVSF